MDKIFILTSTFVDSNTKESSQHIACAYTTRELAERAKKYVESYYMCSFKVHEVQLISK